jgi:hypothetical protein
LAFWAENEFQATLNFTLVGEDRMTDWLEADYNGAPVLVEVDAKTREIRFAMGRCVSMVYLNKKKEVDWSKAKVYTPHIDKVTLPSEVIVPPPTFGNTSGGGGSRAKSPTQFRLSDKSANSKQPVKF